MRDGDIQLRSMPRELSGKKSRLSPAYILIARPHCFKLLAHCALTAAALALLKAGSNIAARIAIIAMTTSSSIKVNAGNLTFRSPDARLLCFMFSGFWGLADSDYR